MMDHDGQTEDLVATIPLPPAGESPYRTGGMEVERNGDLIQTRNFKADPRGTCGMCRGGVCGATPSAPGVWTCIRFEELAPAGASCLPFRRPPGA